MDIVRPKHRPIVGLAVGANLLAAGALLVPWQSVKIVGLTVLTGAAYGIGNDMMACRDCIEYFTLGHQYDGLELRHRPIQTLDPNANAVIWGMIATWWMAAPLGVAIALISRVPLKWLPHKITALQLVPLFGIGTLATLGTGHILSRRAKKAMEDSTQVKYMVPMEYQARWEACNVRNLTGYLMLGLGGLALLPLLLVARTGRIPLPFMPR